MKRNFLRHDLGSAAILCSINREKACLARKEYIYLKEREKERRRLS